MKDLAEHCRPVAFEISNGEHSDVVMAHSHAEALSLPSHWSPETARRAPRLDKIPFTPRAALADGWAWTCPACDGQFFDTGGDGTDSGERFQGPLPRAEDYEEDDYWDPWYLHFGPTPAIIVSETEVYCSQTCFGLARKREEEERILVPVDLGTFWVGWAREQAKKGHSEGEEVLIPPSVLIALVNEIESLRTKVSVVEKCFDDLDLVRDGVEHNDLHNLDSKGYEKVATATRTIGEALGLPMQTPGDGS